MFVHSLTSVIIATTLSSAPASASKPSGTEVEIEIVDRGGGSRSSVGLTVPLEGSIEAWLAEGSRRCEVEAHTVRAGLRLKLACSGKSVESLRLEATRALPIGKRVRLAEVERAGGSRSQVFATVR